MIVLLNTIKCNIGIKLNRLIINVTKFLDTIFFLNTLFCYGLFTHHKRNQILQKSCFLISRKLLLSTPFTNNNRFSLYDAQIYMIS